MSIVSIVAMFFRCSVFAAAFFSVFIAFSFVHARVASCADVKKVLVAPLKYNGPKDAEYVKDAALDMLITRIGGRGIEVAPLRMGGKAVTAPLTDAEATDAAKKSGADYLLYGSISMLGSSMSIDAKLLGTKNNSIETIFAKGEKLESLVGMTEYVASEVERLIKGVSPSAPVAAKEDASVKGTPPPASSYTGKFGGEKKAEAEKVVTPLTADNAKVASNEPGFIEASKAAGGKASSRSNVPDGFFFAMEVIDIDNDGVKEAVLLGENVIHILKYKDGAFKEVKSISDYALTNLALASFDLNGDGSEEIIVSRVKGSVPDTCVLNADKGAFTLASCGIPYLIKAVQAEKGKKTLLGQSFSLDWGFKKKMYVLKTDGGQIKEDKEFELPGLDNISGVDFSDIDGDGSMELLFLDKDDYLRVYKKGDGGKWDGLWKSTDYFGGSLHYVELKKNGSSLNDFATVKEGFRTYDVDGNGTSEVILKKNVAGGAFGRHSQKIPTYKSGAIVGLEWDGAMMGEKWKSKDVTGYLSDFAVVDVDGDGTLDVVMLVVGVEGGKMFSKGKKNYILSYRLKL